MIALYLVLAALFGSLLGAPVWVCAWDRRHRPLARARRTLREHLRRARTTRRHVTALALQRDVGRHATPRNGIPIVPAEYLKEHAA